MGGDQSETFYQDFLQHMRSTYRVDAVKGRNFQKSFPYRYSQTSAGDYLSTTATFFLPGGQKNPYIDSSQRPPPYSGHSVPKVAIVEVQL